MEYLFKKKLSWATWCEVFQSIEEFKPLIDEIFLRDNLGAIKNIKNVTPGTNAVFRVNDYIVKIFVPIEIVDWESIGYTEELENINRAIQNGIKTPKIVSNGLINDLYPFYYIVFEYINSLDVKEVINNYNQEEKIDFVNKIKDITSMFNELPSNNYDNYFIKERILNGSRWNNTSNEIKTEVFKKVQDYDLSESCYVHGDITLDNVLIDHSNDVYLIDFADCVIAPKEYEYPPIVFDLFNCDKVMIKHYFKDNENAVEEIFKGLLLHDYGGDFANILLKRFRNKTLESLNSLNEIKEIISELLS